MKTSLEHLPPEKQGIITDIAKAIAEKVLPEKIILFGSYACDPNRPLGTEGVKWQSMP